MVSPYLSPVTLYWALLRPTLSSAGLSSKTIPIDHETTVHFWASKPNSNTTSKPKPQLLLIHGFGPPGVWQWRQQIPFFARSFHLYIPDLVFFGGSSSTSSDRSEIFQAMSIGKLMEKLGVKKYFVVGTSYGGFVANRMAAMWLERVEKVVIASSGVNIRLRDNVELVKRAKAEKVEELILPETAEQLRKWMALSLFWRPYVPDFMLNHFIHRLYDENRKEKLELLKGLTIGWNDNLNITPLQQEVLILWGEHDYIFPLEKAIELKKNGNEEGRLENDTIVSVQDLHPRHHNNWGGVRLGRSRDNNNRKFIVIIGDFPLRIINT